MNVELLDLKVTNLFINYLNNVSTSIWLKVMVKRLWSKVTVIIVLNNTDLLEIFFCYEKLKILILECNSNSINVFETSTRLLKN